MDTAGRQRSLGTASADVGQDDEGDTSRGPSEVATGGGADDMRVSQGVLAGVSMCHTLGAWQRGATIAEVRDALVSFMEAVSVDTVGIGTS